MKKIIILLLLVAPLVSYAQQLKVYTDNDDTKFLALFAYGLPREVVKTNQEIKDSKFGESGIMRRHHTTKYDDEAIGAEGYNSNQTMSFGFLIAPYNVDEKGAEIKDVNAQKEIGWYDASGWDISIDTDHLGGTTYVNNLNENSVVNDTPTGCVAYRGPSGNDPQGSWRLPTQRELLTMFTIMEHALTLQGANDVENLVINGKYWSSTEFKTSANWKVWYVDSAMGSVIHTEKIDAWGKPSKAYARCIRDIDNDPINK